jgi:chemotaxis protein methyltransferase CheR
MTAPVTPASLGALAAGITARFGLRDVPADRLAEALRERLSLAGCRDVEAYVERLADPHEWQALAAGLTVGETYFYRTPEHFRAFAEVVLPDRLRRCGEEGDRPLRVVSAGCASGEEAYTLAMVIATAPGPQPPGAIAIEAFDLTPAAIARARQARYSPWSLRAMPEPLKRRFFVPDGGAHRLVPALKQRVRFGVRNLLDEDPIFWRPGSVDAIFFRNVGIYLTPAALRQVLARFARALAPGGYLFLGPAESTRGLSDAFVLCQSHDTFYYQRPPARAATSSKAGTACPPWPEAITQATRRIAAITERPASRVKATPASPAPEGLDAALALMAEERYMEALAVAQAPALCNDPATRHLRAAVLSTLGRAAEAEAVCRETLQADPASAEAHYVLALCCEQTGRPDEAIACLDAAMRSDPTFAMPPWQRGRLARRSGATALAKEMLQWALRRLPDETPSRLALFGGGFRREVLEAMCRAEWLACGGDR